MRIMPAYYTPGAFWRFGTILPQFSLGLQPLTGPKASREWRASVAWHRYGTIRLSWHYRRSTVVTCDGGNAVAEVALLPLSTA